VYAVVSADRISIPPGSVLRIPGSWQNFCQLRDSRGDGSIPRLRYRQGDIILLMSPLPSHGRAANIIADIVAVLLESQDRNYEAFTPITTIDRCFTTAKEKGTSVAINELRRSLLKPN
jgi:Uma2 family endonuclease